jgi:hypothetical protein
LIYNSLLRKHEDFQEYMANHVPLLDFLVMVSVAMSSKQ